MSASPPQTANDLILRAEIPELGIRKAIRVPKNASIRSIVTQIQKKANLEDDFVRQARLFKPYQTKTRPSGGHHATNNVGGMDVLGDWLDEDTSLDRTGLSWADHELVQLRRPQSVSLNPNMLLGKVVSKDTVKKLGKMATHPFSKKKFYTPATQTGYQSNAHLLAGSHALPKSAKNSGSFGVALSQVPKDADTGVPLVVVQIVEYLRRNDMQTEGIFRLSGAASRVTQIKDQLDQHPLALDSMHSGDGHAVAGVLKLFLRQLPEPLLTCELYEAWVAVQETVSPILRQFYLHHLVHMLPGEHVLSLKYLCEFFSELADYGHVNKMTLQNLATVLGPNMIRQRVEIVSDLVKNAAAINAIALDLIRNHHTIFMSTEEFVSATHLDFAQFCGVAKAIYPYTAVSAPAIADSSVIKSFRELDLEVGDVLMIQTTGRGGFDEHGWWVAEVVGKANDERQIGIVPSNYLEVLYKCTFGEDSLGDASSAPILHERQDSGIMVVEEVDKLESADMYTKEVATQTDLTAQDVSEMISKNSEMQKEIERLRQRVEMLERKTNRRSALKIETGMLSDMSSPPSSPASTLSSAISTATSATINMPPRLDSAGLKPRRRPAPAPPVVKCTSARPSSMFLEEFLARRIQLHQQLMASGRKTWSPQTQMVARVTSPPMGTLQMSPTVVAATRRVSIIPQPPIDAVDAPLDLLTELPPPICR